MRSWGAVALLGLGLARCSLVPVLEFDNPFDIESMGLALGVPLSGSGGLIEISGASTVTEGSSVDLSVRLLALPAGKTAEDTITATIEVSDTTAITSNKSSLSFSGSTMFSAQTITISATDNTSIQNKAAKVVATIAGVRPTEYSLTANDSGDLTTIQITSTECPPLFRGRMLLDSANSRYIFVGGEGFIRYCACNLAGAACSFRNLYTSSSCNANDLSSVLDTGNAKVLVACTNVGNSNKPSLIRCDLDGTNCAHTDISAGEGTGSGTNPAIVIDTTNSKLLVATTNEANGSRQSLFRCNLDGSGCAHTDVSSAAGQGASTGLQPSLVIDGANAKLLFAARSPGPQQGLYRCNLDGTGCSYASLSATVDSSLLVDAANSKLLAMSGKDSTPTLLRCNLDGTSCATSDISNATPTSALTANTSWHAGGVIDATNSRVHFFFGNGVSGSTPPPVLISCALDGTNCSLSYMDRGSSYDSLFNGFLTALVDPASNRIVLASTNYSRWDIFKVIRNVTE